MEKKIWLVLLTLFITRMAFADPSDPLTAWNEGPAKQAIINFVKASTDKSNPNYIPPSERIATFDQDGTTWVEYPMYTQVIFAFDRVKSLAPQHPEWKATQPFKAILKNDKKAIAKFTNKDLEKIVMATHTGMTVESFTKIVKNWLLHAKDTRWHRRYTELVYQPMLEVMKYLRAHGFKTYIVTGGGQDFVRAYSFEVYGIPPEQIIGSALEMQYQYDADGKSVLLRVPKLLLNDNFSGKPEDIYLFVGRRPAAAFGNSTGDQQMLEYTQIKNRPGLKLLVHHDDGKREYAYGPNSKVGTFSKALLQEAQKQNWIVVSMKKDWRKIFGFEKN